MNFNSTIRANKSDAVTRMDFILIDPLTLVHDGERFHIIKGQVLNAELTSSMFSTPSAPSSHSIHDLNFGEMINVSWTLPENYQSSEVALLFYNQSGEMIWLDNDNEEGDTAVILDARKYTAPDWAMLFIRTTDQFERDFNLSWEFTQ